MITRIVKILNVGRLSDVGGPADLYNLKKSNLIFSHNAHGKSTFTSILRSLKDNNSDLIIGRKTFNSENDPNVVLKISNNQEYVKFENRRWDRTLSNIRIFDLRYINESFFSPDQQVDNNGQQKIETFVLGEKGKEIGENISRLLAKQTENKAAKSSITRKYNTTKQSQWPDTLDKFIKINKIDEFDKLMKTEYDNLASFNNQAQIQRTISSVQDVINTFNVEKIKSNLSDRLQVDISQIIDHIKNHITPDADKRTVSDFFEKGTTISIQNANCCVYCGQTLSGNAITLVEAYGQIYDEKYKALSQNVRNAKNLFETTKIIDSIRRAFDDLISLRVSTQLPTTKDGKGNETSVLENMQNNISGFIDEIKLKRNDLNRDVNFESLDTIKSDLNKISEVLSNLENKYSGDISKQVKLCNSKIAIYKLNKARFSDLWTRYCDEYIQLDKNSRIISEDLVDAYRKQKEYAEPLFASCQTLINQCLCAHGADFKIDKLTPKGRTRGELFQLIFNDGSSPVGLTGNDNVCSVKNTLSESDRRLLCFAFFMASIENEPDSTNLIVVFDDPMSSFDCERRSCMADYLCDFVAKVSPEQVFILSHDKYFIKLLDEKIDSDNKSVMQLLWMADSNKKTSDFIPLDTQKDPMFINDDYYKYRKKLIDYKGMNDNDILNKVENLGYIRKMLEFILKHKYYNLLEQDIKQNGSVTAFMKTLSLSGNPYDGKADLQGKIDRLTPHKPNHDPNPGDFPIDELGVTGIKKMVDDTFKIVEEL